MSKVEKIRAFALISGLFLVIAMLLTVGHDRQVPAPKTAAVAGGNHLVVIATRLPEAAAVDGIVVTAKRQHIAMIATGNTGRSVR